MESDDGDVVLVVVKIDGAGWWSAELFITYKITHNITFKHSHVPMCSPAGVCMDETAMVYLLVYLQVVRHTLHVNMTGWKVRLYV